MSPLELFEENEKLVYFVCNKYRSNMHYSEDLVSEAFIGFWKACLKYDSSFGAFSTFAVRCIYNTVNNYIKNYCNKGVFTTSFDSDILDLEVNYHAFIGTEDVYFTSDILDFIRGNYLLNKVYIKGESLDSIAVELGIHPTSVSRKVKAERMKVYSLEFI